MLATMTKTTTDQIDALDPTMINVTVKISPGGAPGMYHHDVAALSTAGANGSKWIVSWTLETTSPDLSATFNNPGIIVPKKGTKMPKGVKDLGVILSSSTQQQLAFTNYVEDVNVIRYDLDLEVKDSSGKELARANLCFDPTISVVKEPIVG